MCGLLQSLPRIDRAKRAPAAVSGGADWGNVRYGKGFRTQIAIEALRRHRDFANDFALLDVGSNRGSFARAFLDAAPDAHLVAVEPDERVAANCAGLPRTHLIRERIENVALETGRFDAIHSCHTIEHLIHPAATLADHHRILKDGGILILDAPNTALLASDDIVEEWFIDKHLYHFSETTLTRLLEASGFTILERPGRQGSQQPVLRRQKERQDAIQQRHRPRRGRICARPDRDLCRGPRPQPGRAEAAAATELLSLAPRRVAMWGAGRLFDSLVTHGKFDARSLAVLVDKHLKAHVAERHGCALTGPEDLAAAEPGIVVVMSRDFASEIVLEVNKLTPGAEVILYTDLMSRGARRRIGAPMALTCGRSQKRRRAPRRRIWKTNSRRPPPSCAGIRSPRSITRAPAIRAARCPAPTS
ncbi:MAG: class I SAM-dependent methyltransferase [Rhizomicrobium sp.]